MTRWTFLCVCYYLLPYNCFGIQFIPWLALCCVLLWVGTSWFYKETYWCCFTQWTHYGVHSRGAKILIPDLVVSSLGKIICTPMCFCLYPLLYQCQYWHLTLNDTVPDPWISHPSVGWYPYSSGYIKLKNMGIGITWTTGSWWYSRTVYV